MSAWESMGMDWSRAIEAMGLPELERLASILGSKIDQLGLGESQRRQAREGLETIQELARQARGLGKEEASRKLEQIKERMIMVGALLQVGLGAVKFMMMAGPCLAMCAC